MPCGISVLCMGTCVSPSRCEKCFKILFLTAETVIIVITVIAKCLYDPLVMTLIHDSNANGDYNFNNN